MYQNTRNETSVTQVSVPQPHTQRYCLTHDFDGPATLSETVLHAISGAANVNVSNVEDTVYNQLDLDVLDRLFRPLGTNQPHCNGQFTFFAYGHTVTIHGDGRIIITPET